MADTAATVSASLAAAGSRVRSRFFLLMSGVLLLVVLTGFSRTLYLRPAFEVPAIPTYLVLHGVLMTMWFAGVVVQTALVATRRVSWHRALGWTLAAVGVAMIPSGAYVSLNNLARRVAMGADADAIMPAISSVVWTNIGALSCFVILLSAAILLRRRPELHKRLMLLASISMVSPAITRISQWPVFEGIGDPPLFRYCLMLSLFVPLFVHDYRTIKRPHPVTLAGTLGVMGVKAICGWVIATSAVGLEMARLMSF